MKRWAAPRRGGYSAIPTGKPMPTTPPPGGGGASHPKQRIDVTVHCCCGHQTSGAVEQAPQSFAASHMGGSFEQAGYSAGEGVFGFRQDDRA